MSWHAAHGNPDPFAKPAKPGDEFGCWVVVRMVAPRHPRYGLRALFRCKRCSTERIAVIAQLRHKPPVTHRSCAVPANVVRGQS